MPLRSVHFLLPRFSRRAVGGYKVVYEYADHFAATGVRVTVHHSYGVDHLRGGAIRGRRFQGLRWLASFVRDSARRRPGWFPLHDGVRVRLSFRRYRMRLRAGDVVVATSAPTAFQAARAVKGTPGVGGVYFIQHFEDWLVDESYLRRTWELGLRNVVIAPWLLARAEQFGVPAHLVQNAIDASSFRAGPPLQQRPASVVSLVSSALFKRSDVVTEVLNAVAQDPRVAVTAFGTSPRRPDGLDDDVSWLSAPSSSELASLFAAVQVYFCGSDAEGWHLPPAEASMCGAAIVSTDIGGVRAYAGDDAFYASPGDVDGLVDAVKTALKDPALAAANAARVRDRLLARSREQAALEFRRELESALPRPGGRSGS